MKDPVLTDHRWPEETESHLWGPWYPFSNQAQHRTCVHPECNAAEIRKAS